MTRRTRRAATFALVASLVWLPVRRQARAEGLEASALPPPPLTMSLVPPAGGNGGPWRLRIQNTGDAPVRITADPRLLVLDVTPPRETLMEATSAASRAVAKKPSQPLTVRCALPSDARPSVDGARDLVVPSQGAWSSAIDPLFYCFGARERAALVAGATVKAHFGFPAALREAHGTASTDPRARARKAAPPAPPFVAVPASAAIGTYAPAKDIEAAPFTLADVLNTDGDPSNGRAAPGTTVSNHAASDHARAAITVTMPETLDVSGGGEIPVVVTLVNEGDRAATVLFRPEMMRFSVSGPAGSVACGETREVSSPIRELYSTLGVKARASLELLLSSVCEPETFEEPGIYRVTPIFDTTAASGSPIGLKTWNGEATGKRPMLLRVRAPRRSVTSSDPPSLD